MPKDYQFVNAIKMSMLKLQALKDKNGRSALEVCTQNSISTALSCVCQSPSCTKRPIQPPLDHLPRRSQRGVTATSMLPAYT
ncbi:MAG: hypothetical protein II304_10115, partial [Bacteroidales bacterium]|nr:hypothetical protein [Bacteroidales bacterium]